MKVCKLMGLVLLTNFVFSQENQSPVFSYIGGWPVNPKSDTIEDPGFDLPCPGPTGCDCQTNADCYNHNCRAHPKGNYCVPKAGDLIPRFEAIDQFGESVDLYDFAHQGKMTLIAIHAKQSREDLPNFTKVFGSGECSDEDLSMAVSELEILGSIEYARNKAMQHHSLAHECLSKLPNSQAVDVLKELTDFQLIRIN